MDSRRNFIKSGLLGASAMTLGTNSLFAKDSQTPPTRFIFLRKGNGLLPETMAPPSLNDKDKALEKSKSPFEVDLVKHELPDWMAALNQHKENMTILQGISGKMCTTGHHAWCSSLGAFKANQRLSSIKWATVDFELAKLFPSPFEHIELACFPQGGGDGRGDINGIEKGFSAIGPQQPNYAYGSPKIAIQELFKSVSSNSDDQIKYELDRNVLKFIAQQEQHIADDLKGHEKTKVKNYADSLQAIRRRNTKVDSMKAAISKNIPKLDKKYFADDVNTFDRQDAFTEILLSTIISGMTNVLSFTLDELGTDYTGITGMKKSVNQHDVGHNKSFEGVEPLEIRKRIRTQHMKVINNIVSGLKKAPEGNGTMFDNTVILYSSSNGETHHSNGSEFPFIIMAGKNTKMNLGGRYIRLPKWGDKGCQTLGNLYTTILNAYGNPIKHYGDFDSALKFDQSGPIKQLMV
jgi:hypothetical protein